jgi:hypothetical protein
MLHFLRSMSLIHVHAAAVPWSMSMMEGYDACPFIVLFINLFSDDLAE